MDPRYFLDEASLEEIGDFLEGASERSRDLYEAARMVAFVAGKIGGAEAETFQDFMPFTWDEEQEEDDGYSEDVENLRVMAKNINSKIK